VAGQRSHRTARARVVFPDPFTPMRMFIFPLRSSRTGPPRGNPGMAMTRSDLSFNGLLLTQKLLKEIEPNRVLLGVGVH